MGLLRILLAISIIFDHTGKPFGYEIISSKVAIHTFFIISGFYMALIINEKYNLKKSAYKVFITNRFLRIYPVYWIALILTGLMLFIRCDSSLGSCLFVLPQASFINSVLNAIEIFLKNVFLFPFLGYFSPNANSLGNFIVPISWTLGIELLFYLMAPFIVKRDIKIIILIGLLSLLTRNLVFQYNASQPHDFLTLNTWFFPSQLIYFMLGIISYRIYVKLKKIKISNYIYVFSSLFMVLFTLSFAFLINLLQGKEDLIGWIYYFCMVLIIPLFFNFTKKNKLINLLGELSYSIYITHVFIILLLPITLLKVNKDFYPLIIVLTTFIFALLLRKFIELPIDKFRQRNLKSKK